VQAQVCGNVKFQGRMASIPAWILLGSVRSSFESQLLSTEHPSNAPNALTAAGCYPATFPPYLCHSHLRGSCHKLFSSESINHPRYKYYSVAFIMSSIETPPTGNQGSFVEEKQPGKPASPNCEPAEAHLLTQAQSNGIAVRSIMPQSLVCVALPPPVYGAR
jgi:hypothetical protein